MTRRTRSAVLLSAATLLAGSGLTLALAPTAAADIPTPPLGTLSAAPANPTAGDLVRISGTGCFTLGTGGGPSSAPGAPAAASAGAPADASTDASAAAAPAAAPKAAPAGSVTIVITGPGSFRSTDTATASDDGTWSGDQGITIGDAGDYTVDATCTLTDPVLQQQVGFDYDSLPLTVDAPAQQIDPLVTCNGCTSVNPGGSVTLGGTGFPANTTATISLSGYADKTSRVDAQGGFSPVSIVIAADQAAGSISGTVSAPGADAVAFTVNVTVPQQPGGDADGPVPGDDGGTDGTVSGGGTDGGGTGVTYPVTTSAPTLPQTGASVWPGVIGGALVLTGGGLLWLGRRREPAGATAA